MRKKISVFTAAGLFFYFLNYLGNNPKTYVDKITSEYSGVIIERYFLKVTQMKIKTDSGIINLAMMSNGLIRNAQVGDSIYKIKNDNKCILVHHNRRMPMEYTVVPNSIRNDHRWPKELSKIKATD